MPTGQSRPKPRTEADRRLDVTALRWQLPALHAGLVLGAWGLVALWNRPVGVMPAFWVAAAAALAGSALMAVWLHRRLPRRDDASATVGSAPAAGRELRELMRLLPDGVLLLVDDRVAFANPAGEAMFGYAPEGLTGVAVSDLVPEQDRDAVESWRRAPDACEPPPTLPMRRRDGSVFRAALTVAQTRHEQRPCTLLVVRDLTDAERMRDELAAGNRELQALAVRVLTLQEDERRAISRELHDDIGQSVTAMKMAAGSALDEDDAQRRRDDLEDILMLADATLERLRDISILLRPPQLDALGLEAALRWHAERLLRNAGIEAALDIHPLPQRPDPGVEQACFRIAQEALTNVVRHARAGRVQLTLRDAGDGLDLSVHDDGRGFAPEAARGLGLVIMRERAHGAGGRLEVSASPGSGTRLDAWLPYAPATVEAAAAAGRG